MDPLRHYISLLVAEVLASSPRCNSQIVSKDRGGDLKTKDEDDLDEMSTVATSLSPGGGFTGPFGAPPGARRKDKKQVARWK